MRERSMVAFTLLAQTAVGTLWALTAVWWLLGDAGEGLIGLPLLAVGALAIGGLAASLLHLGSPARAWRALAGLRTSWLSREVLLALLLVAGWSVLAVAHGLAIGPSGLRLVLALVVSSIGVGLVYSMARVYRLRTVPAWDTRLTTASFFLTAVSSGALMTAVMLALGTAALPGTSAARTPEAEAVPPTLGEGIPAEAVPGDLVPAGTSAVWSAVWVLMLVAVVALALELWLEPAWRNRRRAAVTRLDRGLVRGYGGANRLGTLRCVLLVTALLLAGVATLIITPGGAPPAAGLPLAALAFAAAVGAGFVGRVVFYGSYGRLGV